MTRPESVHYLRTEPTMAFPDGRLLARKQRELYLLAPDGWTRLGVDRPVDAKPLTRQEAEDWCEREGIDWQAFEGL
ncbi:hypothetical protein [Kutzneria chonburiensis]|jgi:hypothetical protein|uniref:Uncharacterized protein n=1 Tax=Kutzneria chonburiensis TaxID=1483604 RepID=A0ABV6N340_9PSEU|nr:hypothetical protein [Kutzneria chonburiensis]